VSTINAINPNTDLTVQIFDRFYEFQQGVPAQEYDAVYSYLRSVFNTAEQAANFATTTFRIASASGIPVMDLLEQLKGQSGVQITLTFAFYLNALQSPSTKLGVQLPTLPNFYVAHNIKQ
jgi:hypothetical protein